LEANQVVINRSVLAKGGSHLTGYPAFFLGPTATVTGSKENRFLPSRQGSFGLVKSMAWGPVANVFNFVPAQYRDFVLAHFNLLTPVPEVRCEEFRGFNSRCCLSEEHNTSYLTYCQYKSVSILLQKYL
jgi:hypothetical protein